MLLPCEMLIASVVAILLWENMVITIVWVASVARSLINENLVGVLVGNIKDEEHVCDSCGEPATVKWDGRWLCPHHWRVYFA